MRLFVDRLAQIKLASLTVVIGEAVRPHAAFVACLADSRLSGKIGRRVFIDGRDLVVVSGLVPPGRSLAVWGLKRYIDFNSSNHLIHQLVLGGLMLVSLISIGAVLRLSFSMQRGFAAIQAG